MLTYGCYFPSTANNAIQMVSLTVVEQGVSVPASEAFARWRLGMHEVAQLGLL